MEAAFPCSLENLEEKHMKLGIVGLPNVGKSTLFNAITQAGAESANYPFCTIDPNVGMVAVPDERLQPLTDLYHAKKTTPAVVEFVDIAGLVRGASKGEGLATSSCPISARSTQSYTLSAASTTRTSFTSRVRSIRRATSRPSISSSFLRTSSIWNAVWSVRARRQRQTRSCCST